MITALVQFKVPAPLTPDKAQEMFLHSAPSYSDVQGLIRKYYLLSEDGTSAGGVYLWSSRQSAEDFYSQDWKDFIFQKYGAKPSITYFYSPVVVDNLIGEIIST